jgi:hypothetical protein
MKKLIQLLEAKVKLNSSGCPNIDVDSDIGLDLVNDALLSGICSAAKAAGVNVQITSAVSDHPEKTDSGAISRHSKGQAVDISKINGKSVEDPSNKTNVDNFVSQLEILGYKRNSEKGGNPKSVLWQMLDHDNHVHVSNTEESSTTSTNSSTSSTEDTKTDVTSNSSGKKIMGDLIGATFGDMLGLKEQRVKKEIGKIRNLLK